MKIWDGCADESFIKLNVSFIFPAAVDVKIHPCYPSLLLLVLLLLLLFISTSSGRKS
jgi:hypothetical protein